MNRKALAVVGVVALAAAASVSAQGPGRPGRRGRPVDVTRHKQELGLTDAQVDQIQKLRSDQQKRQIRRRADLQLARVELRELLAAGTVDEKAVAAKVKELSDLQGAALKARVDGQLAMRKIFTPEQHDKLRQLRRERRMERRQARPGPRVPRPRPGRGPGAPGGWGGDDPAVPDDEDDEPPLR
jgi:Spy/CpxP family protein refolding chaperone